MRKILLPVWALGTGCVIVGGIYTLAYKSRVADAVTYTDLYAVMVSSYSELRLWAVVSWIAVGASWLILGAWTANLPWPPSRPGQRLRWLGSLMPVVSPILAAVAAWRSALVRPRFLLPVWVLLSVAATLNLAWSAYSALAPEAQGLATDMSFVAGDTPVPEAVRDSVRALNDRPSPAIRDVWSLILFSVFAVGTAGAMRRSVVGASKRNRPPNGAAEDQLGP